MTGLARAFAALRLSRGGVRIPEDETKRALAEAESFAQSRTSARPVVREADPLHFALRFLAALDHGHCPTPLPPDASARLEAGLDLLGTTAPLPFTYVCLTSGTTAAPRGVTLSVAGAQANASAHAASFGLDATDTVVQSLPMFHAFGIVSYLFAPLAVGCGVDLNVVPVTPAALDERGIARAILHTTPSIARFIGRDRRAGGRRVSPATRILSVGASAIGAAEVSVLAARLPETELYVTYGLTEAGPRVTTGRVGAIPRPSGYVGEALSGIELRVARQGALATHGTGRLALRSPSTSSELVLTDGFFVTRDDVTLDPKGSVVFHGRAEDLLKVSGVSVYPSSLAETIRGCPGVSDCFVRRRSDPVHENVFDLVVEGDVAVDLVRSYAARELSFVERPREIVVLAAFPRTALGKVDRPALEDVLRRADAGLDRQN